MNKMEYKDLKRKTCGKEKRKDKISIKYGKNDKANKNVNQMSVAYWGNFSSDSDNSKQGENVFMLEIEYEVIILYTLCTILDTLFALTANTKNDDDNPETLFAFKKILKDYSLSKP